MSSWPVRPAIRPRNVWKQLTAQGRLARLPGPDDGDDREGPTQAPLGALQAHLSYSISPKTWAAFDATWYGGGQASVNGVPAGASQSNSRVGATLAFPVGSRHGIKLAWSRGAIVRFGANFTTVSIGWQTVWLDRRPAAQK